MVSALPPPPVLPTNALAAGLEAFVAVRAAIRAGIADSRATFEYSFSRTPQGASFLVLCGLEPLLDALERFRVKPDELSWLESVGAIDEQTKQRLENARFGCDIDAAREGGLVFPGEPVVVVEGPFWQAQLVGALVESALGDATLVATKFARCALAAEGGQIVEWGSAAARRLGGAPLLARAAYIGGAHATTNALAGKRYGVPVRAIQPLHMARASRADDGGQGAWLSASPHAGIVRLDDRDDPVQIARLTAAAKARAKQSTWDEGTVGVAIEAARAGELGREVRRAFEEAGLREPQVMIAGPLDETAILELGRRAAGQAFAVSAHVAEDAQQISGYALAALEEEGAWSPRVTSRASVAAAGCPGRKVLLRYIDAEGRPIADVLHMTNERHLRPKDGRFIDLASGVSRSLRGATGSAPMLTNVMRAGKRVSAAEAAKDIRARRHDALLALPERHRSLTRAAPYPVGMTAALAALKADLLGP